MGHVPYFNHMIRLQNDEKGEEKIFMHQDNSENVILDTFSYIMQIVNHQCDLYNQGKEFIEKSLINKYKRPLPLCGFNSANYDLYLLQIY